MSKSTSPSLAVVHHIRDNCLCLHVQRAARVVARHFDEALRPLELTNGQFSLLVSLNRSKPPTIGYTSALLAMDRTTLTANLKPLERRGLVKVQVDKADRRSRLMVLTLAGKELLAAAVPIWRKAHAAAERKIGKANAERLRTDLRKFA
ncbi:MAG: winged helix-turn-helix transcriptional regulator [Proteobacteria bacterium]|nr:winged helix-turn-helix transcriptional regulator [Pseudomonadota bacterium]